MLKEQLEERVEIRASSLSGQSDCFRRAAAANMSLRALFKRQGYEFKDRGNNAGNVIGSACHDGVGAVLEAKMAGLTADPYTHAEKKFDSIIRNGGCPTDRETPDESTARQQIKRMILEIMPHINTLKPKKCESKLENRVDPLKPYFITGHFDVLETTDDIRDFKFGKKCSPYEAQLGAYRIMLRSAGQGVGRLFVDWVKRCSLKQPQKSLEVIEYNVVTAENAAFYAIDHAVTQIEKFKETGNVQVFPANPNSMLCSKKWCLAWGTPMCDLGRPDKTDD